MKTFNILVLAVLGFTTHGYATSCLEQGGACHDGDSDCPAGTRSVYWDSGCATGQEWSTNDEQCCVPT